MLEVNYKNRIGYYTETQIMDGQKYKYKMWICHANCLCAMMYFYEKEQDGEMVKMERLQLFFVDDRHARACIEHGVFEHCSNFHFKAKQMNADLWKLVKTMTANGIKVTIE